MYYLFTPNRTTRWLNLSHDMIELARQNNPNLDITTALDWDDAERPLDNPTLALVLRYGLSGAAGIAVDVGDLVPLDHLRRLMEIEPRNSAMPIDDVIEQMSPGWKERGRQLDAQIAESMSKAVEEAQRDYVAALDDRPVDDTLVAHWRAMGGVVPNHVL